MIKVMALRPKHEAALADFFRAIRGTETERKFHPHPFDDENARRIANYEGRDIYLVTLENGIVLAYGMLRSTDPYPDPSLGIAVRTGLEGRGLGTEMMKHLISAARATGAPFVTLFVYSWNPAWHLYERMGFELSPAPCPPRALDELKGILRF